MKKKKGQAAIEFLTTYSWAILGILLTIGALMYFDVFNTNRFITERCETGAQISCVEAAVTEDGQFNIRLTNGYPVAITINSITLSGSAEHIHIPIALPLDFNRGETQTINFLIPNAQFSRNTRESFDITINFQRQGGTHSYNVTGNVVVRPLPAGVI